MVFNATFNNISGSSWPWSYGSWIYNYQFNQCLSPMMLWVRISIRARCTTLCDKVCQWLVTGRWFSTGFLHQSNWPPRYNWNIVESGVKHHKPTKQLIWRKITDNYTTIGTFLIHISDYGQHYVLIMTLFVFLNLFSAINHFSAKRKR